MADIYATGAQEAGHEIKRIEIANLSFPILRTQAEFEDTPPTDVIRSAQETISWAEHIVLIYPLWLGSMPALTKAFLEQVFRPGFAFDGTSASGFSKRLKGRSARIVVTMGMPAVAYRWYFRAHSLKNLKRNILGFCGIGPCRDCLIGMIENLSETRRQKWLERMRAFGRRSV